MSPDGFQQHAPTICLISQEAWTKWEYNGESWNKELCIAMLRIRCLGHRLPRLIVSCSLLQIISTVTAALEELPKEEELKEKVEKGSSSSQDTRCTWCCGAEVETSRAKMCLQVI